MVQIKAKKPIKIKNKNFEYDFRQNIIQDIEDENHVQILLNTNKFDLIN